MLRYDDLLEMLDINGLGMLRYNGVYGVLEVILYVDHI